MIVKTLTSCSPSSQLLRPSSDMTASTTVAIATAPISKPLNMKSIGRPSARLMKTTAGAPNTATCVDEPTAISRRSEQHTPELQSQSNPECRLLLEQHKRAHVSPH